MARALKPSLAIIYSPLTHSTSSLQHLTSTRKRERRRRHWFGRRHCAFLVSYVEDECLQRVVLQRKSSSEGGEVAEKEEEDGTWRVVVVVEGGTEGEEAANADSGRERVEGGPAFHEDCVLHIAFEVASECFADSF
ncbi:hypothetical protein FNV43_RR26037 [Rhamnella rubrinervis]|uniref:Uncharacterized protein n=1 Tax=Rhamnella rubrinervis TaxID=2594499 RepID=A0A8K0GNE6_9ROSA|nr:hypothetical protein FNV43_RR26037 [Rhamnella rubrinervis]